MRPILRSSLLAASCVAAVVACSHRSKTPGNNPPVVQRDAVNADDIARTPSQPIEQQLMAKVPGIIVTRTTSGEVAILIRGGSSAYGNNDPLYVVDGMTVQPGAGGALTGLNPYDIASIQVLKDAGALAMYGSRGANGVILIKTKQSTHKRQ